MSLPNPFELVPPPEVPQPPTPPSGGISTSSVAPTVEPDLGGQPDIVPWGPPGSGKTTLLATMLYMLGARVNNFERRINYDVFPFNEGAKEFMRREVSDLRNGILPQPNRVGDAAVMTSRTFLIGFRDRDGDGLSGHFHHLLLMDAAGEETNPNSRFDTIYWKRALNARGVLMVINGAEENSKKVRYQDGTDRSYSDVFMSFLDRTNMSFKRKPYLAICLTQADRVYKSPDDTGLRVLEPKEAHQMNILASEPTRRFKEIVGEDAYRRLVIDIGENNFKIFITSATGWYRDKQTDTWHPNTEKTPEGWRLRATGDQWWTVGALYPLMWLFDMIEEERYRETRTRRRLIKRYKERLTNQRILKEEVALPDYHPYWL